MLLTLAVVLSAPHDYSGTFQGGYNSRLCSLKVGWGGVLKGARRASSVSLASTCDLPVTTSVDPLCLPKKNYNGFCYG